MGQWRSASPPSTSLLPGAMLEVHPSSRFLEKKEKCVLSTQGLEFLVLPQCQSGEQHDRLLQLSLVLLLILVALALGVALGAVFSSLLFVLAWILFQLQAVIHRGAQIRPQILKRLQNLESHGSLAHGGVGRHQQLWTEAALAAAGTGTDLCSVLEPTSSATDQPKFHLI